MNTIIKLLLLTSFMLLSKNSVSQCTDQVKVTYISNSGYFIETGNTNILIDAVFSECVNTYSCPDSLTIERIINGESPFEKVDLALVTHYHPDHVDDSLLIAMLNKRTDFELLVPKQVYDSMLKQANLKPFENRIHCIKLANGEQLNTTFKQTEIDIARSKHGDTYDIENLCYIINDKGFRILHIGDSWPESLIDLDDSFFHDIDLAIIPISFGKDLFKVHDSVLSPNYTLISHVKTDFVDRFKMIIKKDTATFNSKDVLFEPFESIYYQR